MLTDTFATTYVIDDPDVNRLVPLGTETVDFHPRHSTRNTSFGAPTGDHPDAIIDRGWRRIHQKDGLRRACPTAALDHHSCLE